MPAGFAADLLAAGRTRRQPRKSILITDSNSTCRRRSKRRGGSTQLAILPRADIARASWNEFGRHYPREKPSTRRPDLANAIAAEHLEIMTADPEGLSRANPQCRRDLPWSAHPGSDRRLCRRPPTMCCRRARSARFSSGLGVLRLHEAHVDSQMADRDQLARRLGPAAMDAGRGPKVLTPMRGSVGLAPQFAMTKPPPRGGFRTIASLR